MARSYRALLGPAGRVVEVGGLQATVLDAFPDATLANSVHYRGTEDVTGHALSALERDYEAAGVRSWSVWTRPGDREVLRPLLTDHGHVLDARPLLMAGRLAEMQLDPRTDLDVERHCPWSVTGRIIDEAFRFDAAYFEEILGAQGPTSDGPPRWIARLDADPVACVIAVPDGDEVNVAFVAVAPSAQGLGLATELLRHALRDCRADGAATASLESTGDGEGVYARIGFRAYGRLGNWKRDTARRA